jgi:histidyl-tRNA synthetase
MQLPPQKWPDLSNLIDRRSKMNADQWEAWALEIGVDRRRLDELKAILGDEDLWKGSPEMVRLFDALDAMGVREYVEFNPNIMRGLLYYTGTVFEAFETSGSLKRAIFGGGRYDNLLADVGGQPLPAVGFAMGDMVIGILLQEAGLLPEFAPCRASVLVTLFDRERSRASLELSRELRDAGINTIVYPEPARLQRQFKFADRMKIAIAVTIGPQEAEQGSVSIKDLRTGVQTVVPRPALSGEVKRMLG